MVIERLQKKKKEKGIGYIIEAFIAAIILFIFAFSHHAEAPETRDWTEFQDQVGANDLTYVMEKTDHTSRMLSRGQTGSIQAVFSGITDDRLSVSGTVENTPIGESRIGVYTPESDIHNENLVEVTSGDRCYNELDEIESEHPVLRTQDEEDSLERLHGVRLYLADSDPTHPTGQDGEENYDTFWVDNGTACSFTSAEGPHLIDNYFLWENKTNNKPNAVYDLKSVDPDSNELTVYNASIAGEIREELKKPTNSLNVHTDFESFTFPKDSLNYDLIIIQSRDNLDTLNNNAEQIMEYQKDGSLLLLMDLQKDDLETEFLNKTGLKWIDLDRNPQENITAFTDSTESRKAQEYFRSLGCTDCELDFNLGGKISSGTDGYATGMSKILVGANSHYETQEWNSEETSMQETSERPEGLPDTNCEPYTQADFEFPTEEDTGEFEELTVYNVPLGSDEECTGFRGVVVDLDGDGEFTGSNEEVHVSDDEIEINGVRYRVEVDSENEAGFTFNGDNRVEFVNYRKEFPESDIGRFARMNNIAKDDIESEESKIASSIVLWLLEDERTFGEPTTTGVETSAIGGIKTDSYIPYRMYLRWSN